MMKLRCTGWGAAVLVLFASSLLVAQQTDEATAPAPATESNSHYEKLKELEWLIGSWIVKDEEQTLETTCSWTKNQNFISRTFKVVTSDGRELEGTQVIGWDPSRNTIRSWMFDSEGAFGAGVWSREGSQWTVRVLQTLKNGESASAINVLTYVDENSFRYKSTGREVDGKLLPNVPETVVNRKSTD